jgi:hypothetical protein
LFKSKILRNIPHFVQDGISQRDLSFCRGENKEEQERVIPKGKRLALSK